MLISYCLLYILKCISAISITLLFLFFLIINDQFNKLVRCACIVSSVRSVVRPEKHTAKGLRRTERPDGDEHHLEREEGDQVDRTADEQRPGVPESRGCHAFLPECFKEQQVVNRSERGIGLSNLNLECLMSETKVCLTYNEVLFLCVKSFTLGNEDILKSCDILYHNRFCHINENDRKYKREFVDLNQFLHLRPRNVTFSSG